MFSLIKLCWYMAPTGRFGLPRRLLADLAVFKTALFSHLSMWAYMVLPTRFELVMHGWKPCGLTSCLWEQIYGGVSRTRTYNARGAEFTVRCSTSCAITPVLSFWRELINSSADCLTRTGIVSILQVWRITNFAKPANGGCRGNWTPNLRGDNSAD